MTRRSFLRGSALFMTSIVTSDPLFGQEQEKQKDKDETGENSDKKDGEKEEDPYKVNHLDSHGVIYRICPECGGMMYKEGCTWLCEACGYSYEEC